MTALGTTPLLADPRRLLLELADERDPDRVLELIVSRLADAERVALARIWLLRPGDECATCPMRDECSDHRECLHLVTSRGGSRDGRAWTRTDGAFRRFPLGVRKVGRIGADAAAIEIRSGVADSPWIADPDWARREGIDGFVGQPLVHHGDVLGVLAVFTRGPLGEACVDWLRMITNHAAAALANARAFAEIARLREQLAQENDYLRAEVEDGRGLGDLLGSSPPMEQLGRRIRLVAETDATVLILGESGTGKELVAREIHRASRRVERPLIRVNCAAIPRELFESEFFGHVKGAFTGALRDRVGRFELADGGTLFLDEVGEIPLDLQAKLLRVLQEGELERVGEEVTRQVDVRILAATHRDLATDVERGAFRADLFYRLSVFPIEVPPLRERGDDVLRLAELFVRQAAVRLGRRPPRIPRAVARQLETWRWPGNVRELQHVVERAVLMSTAGVLELELAPGRATPAARGESAPRPGVMTADEVRQLEIDNLRAALDEAGGKVYGKDGAAELLGMRPTTLASRLKALGIDPRRARTS